MGRPRGDLLVFALLSLFLLQLRFLSGKPIDVPVGVVLQKESVIGRTGLTGLRMALDDFYAAHPNHTTRIRLHFRDYDGNIVAATSVVISLLKEKGAKAIIGPQGSGEAEFLAELANRTRVPMMSFSATSPFLSSRNTPYFIRTAVEDSAQAAPIAAIVKNFEWSQVVLIYQDSEYGSAIVPSLIDALRKVNCKVHHRSAIPESPSDDFLQKELYKLKSMQTRVFVVHTLRETGMRLLSWAHDLDMMSRGYAWIVTVEITTILEATRPTSALTKLEGVIGLKPYVPQSEKVDNFRKKWKKQHHSDKPEEAAPSHFVLWAYDTATALATAVESAGISHPTSHVSTNSLGAIHDLASLGVSPVGPSLLANISAVHFDGLAGKFKLVEGQLRSEGFKIVKVIKGNVNEIGFWRGDGKNVELAPAKWPGETCAVPKGWVTAVSEKRLRIGVPVPVEPGFQNLLRIEWNRKRNTSTVSGFAIDVFEAAVARLPYSILWDYVPFQTPNWTSAGTYDDLIGNISKWRFDGIVGDVTITNQRAKEVDFTMPYTSSGVLMVVPKRDQTSTGEWIFVIPLTTKLWMVIFALFIGLGFVIWILEHRNNDEFQGNCFQQLGTVLYFSFSTLVFAHREKIESPISKVILVVWLFVVLTLQSSYTANLTTMLTLRQLEPTVTNYSELIRNNQQVGYLANSFMKQKLIGVKFNESKLSALSSPQDYAKHLANGSVAAIIDETPYLRLFYRDHCSNYTMTHLQIKTNGFGFAFPRGSPLVRDLSKAILNITEGDTMVEIERKWLLDPLKSCSVESSISSSNSLGFKSFWILFAFTGAVTTGILVYHFSSYFYKKSGGDLKKGKIEEKSWHGTGNESPESMYVRTTGECETPPLASNGPPTPVTPYLTPYSPSPLPPVRPMAARAQERFSDHGGGF